MSTSALPRPLGRLRPLAAALLAALLLVLAAAPAPAAPPPHANHERTLSVLTRNLYLGATLAPLFPEPPLSSPEQVVAASTQLWHQVLATDFRTRAGALADEVAATTPDLLGLQEVTLYRTGVAGDPAPAAEVRLDFLEVLQAELAARGLHYRVVSSQAAFDGELTALDWPAAAGGTGGLVDIRLTDRDVILVRESPRTADIRVVDEQSGLFDAALELPVLGQPLRIERGWTAVDLQHRGRRVRFVNTHLEAFAQPVAEAQVIELLSSGPAATDLPVILVGDFNSAPGEAAYQRITAAGFTDVAVGGQPTCCYDAGLADPGSTLTSRIDLVFLRGGLQARDVMRVGVEPFQDRAPRWASDHAGLYAEIVLP